MARPNSKVILFCLSCLSVAVLSEEDSCDANSGTCKNGGTLVVYSVGDQWLSCSTNSGSAVVCTPATPLEASRAEVAAISRYEASLLHAQESKAIAKKAWIDCSSARTHLEQLEKLLKKSGAAVEKDLLVVIEKLKSLHLSLGKSLPTLDSMVEEAYANRKQSSQSIIDLKDAHHIALTKSANTWTDRLFMKRDHRAWQAYSWLGDAHDELDTVEKALRDSVRKIYNALTPDSTQRTTGIEVNARRFVDDALPLLKSASWWDFGQKASMVEEIHQYESRWKASFEKAKDFAAKKKTNVALPLVETNHDTARHFLDVVVKEAFLNLAPCVAESDYTLSSYLGDTGEDAYMCLRVASKCLKVDTVCGCYRSSKELPIAHHLMEQRQLPEIFGDDRHVATGCSHMIFAATRTPVNIGSSPVTPSTSCAAREAKLRPKVAKSSEMHTPFRICMITWNVGSEREVPLSGAGMGWGGVEGEEFDYDFRRLLQEGCTHANNDVVVFSLQEASDTQSREKIDKAVESLFGDWHVHHVFAGAVDFVSEAAENGYGGPKRKGYGGLEYLRELGPVTKYVPGVHLIVLTRSKPKAVRHFGMIFKAGMVKQWTQQVADWLGDKGTALAQVQLVHDGQERTICFAGSHFDAGKEDKRVEQTAKTQEALKVIGCPDGAWWGGDFNPRLFEKGPSQHCCPWNQMEFLMHHGEKNALVDLSLRIDPISQGYSWRQDTPGAAEVAPFTMKDWHCKGQQCTAGWHEFPIGFAPTFHKLYHRNDRGPDTEGTCHFTSRDIPKVAVHGPRGLLSIHDLHLLNNASFALQLKSDDKCPGSGHRVELCWDAEYNFHGCAKRGYCHHVHHKDHCPLYTDRILHAFNLAKTGTDFRELASDSKFPLVVGGRYESLPSITTADHAPTLAEFTVTW